jgi:hypothetical protein
MKKLILLFLFMPLSGCVNKGPILADGEGLLIHASDFHDWVSQPFSGLQRFDGSSESRHRFLNLMIHQKIVLSLALKAHPQWNTSLPLPIQKENELVRVYIVELNNQYRPSESEISDYSTKNSNLLIKMGLINKNRIAMWMTSQKINTLISEEQKRAQVHIHNLELETAKI